MASANAAGDWWGVDQSDMTDLFDLKNNKKAALFKAAFFVR